MEHYSPTVLFRQNAVKKVRSNPEFYSSSTRKFSNESWLFKDDKNTTVLDKTCSNDTIKIASNYWKVPDDELYLTSVAVNKENNEQIAVASGKRENNLYIYDINTESTSLTHQQTITLPYIQSMQWLGYDECESTLMTGHKNGTVHMVSVPDSNSDESARIIKRFNHKKHFSTSRYKNLSIKRIVTPNWISNSQNFLTQCNQNIFLWDMNHRSDLPILKNQNLGLLNFDASPSKNGILALAGEFGIALNDLRAPVNHPSIFTPKDSKSLSGANAIKWAPYDDNVLAATHLDGTIRLWDIRAQGAFGNLSGHNDLVTCIEWSEESSGDLYSGGNDGSIIHWDLNFSEDLSDCCLSEGLESIKYMGNTFLTDETEIYAKVSKRQCGTLIPAAKAAILDMTSVGNKIMSVDGDSFLGVHGKRGLDSFVVEEGTSAKIMDELLHSIPSTHHDSGSAFTYNTESGSDSEESLFEQCITSTATSSASTTPNSSPTHTREKSITNLQNTSENSINTLVDLQPRYKTVERRTSGSTLNSIENDDLEHDVRASFTYEKIMPLMRKSSVMKQVPEVQQMTSSTYTVRSMVI
ncbi:Protein DSE1 [Cyberlindnera fabianii]|uniref:Protein DSE1 n=1 Tax=Cyberlindnera fabianii TaxID=36022 RepID=A0A1V2LEE5_CYBFA|nr:Protein DSE1 [Cyberlindnera fabianii]